MRLTQYLTNPNGFLQKKSLSPMPTAMEGAKEVRLGEPLANDRPFLGFGVALTGSSCYLLHQMEGDERTALLQDLYGKDGLGLSVARLTVGSSDYSPELYSYNDTAEDREMKHFSVARDEAYVIPMVKEVQRVCPEVFFYASPWSPPGWMKTGGSMCGGYMRADYLDCYADYLLRYLQAYDAHGIRVQALTLQNETETHQSGRMPACLWHPDLEAQFALILKEKLQRSGRDAALWFYDHNFNGWKRVAWCYQAYPALHEALDAVAFHYYGGSVEQLEELREALPSLQWHFTEGGPRLYDHYGDDFCKWGIMMAKALRHGARSFTGWNLMLDETGNPNIGPFFCGGLVTRHSQTGELTYSGQYRALSHFARFTKPGAQILPVEVKGGADSLFAYPQRAPSIEGVACRNPDGTVAVHLINPHTEKRQVQLRFADRWWYAELLPDTLCTLVFEEA